MVNSFALLLALQYSTVVKGQDLRDPKGDTNPSSKIFEAKGWRDPICGYWVPGASAQSRISALVITTVTGEQLQDLYENKNYDRWNFDQQNPSAYYYRVQLHILSYKEPASTVEVEAIVKLLDAHCSEFSDCYEESDRESGCDRYQCPELFDLVLTKTRELHKQSSVLDIHIEPNYIDIDF